MDVVIWTGRHKRTNVVAPIVDRKQRTWSHRSAISRSAAHSLTFHADDRCPYTFTGHRERAQNKITQRLNRQAILDEKMKKFLAVRFLKKW